MKNLLRFSLLVSIIIALAFTAFTQKGQNKNNQKGQQQNKGKKEQNDYRGNKDIKDNKGNNGNNGNGNGKQGNKEANGNQGNNDVKNNNNGRNDDHMNRDKKDPEYGYKWDRENFKDRRKIKSHDKVTVCHKFNGKDDDPAVTIRVSSNALKAHLGHGDIMGDCPPVTNRRFSDIFLRKRSDYYNNLQESQEQVLYSRSMLDYALARLADSRSQLTLSQNRNMPQDDIRRKQATVQELEQNVSLLETLIGVAANLVMSKFQ
ncbi:MAG TPA: hypothetical protein VMZ03_03710 [Chitinophagaceae bacterium]|nr:hypothetical protein [Chitinophagaceae bacterium]